MGVIDLINLSNLQLTCDCYDILSEQLTLSLNTINGLSDIDIQNAIQQLQDSKNLMVSVQDYLNPQKQTTTSLTQIKTKSQEIIDKINNILPNEAGIKLINIKLKQKADQSFLETNCVSFTVSISSPTAAVTCDSTNPVKSVEFSLDETQNPLGISQCSNACQCDGLRFCYNGWCQGGRDTICNFDNPVKNVDYHYDESHSPMGNKKCVNNCECDGVRTCRKGVCLGTARF